MQGDSAYASATMQQHFLTFLMRCHVYIVKSLQDLSTQEGRPDVNCPPPTFYFLPNLVDNLQLFPDEEACP